MKSLFSRTALILAIDVLILAAGAVNIPRLLDRPASPILLLASDAGVYVDEVTNPADAGGLRVGDVIRAWNGAPVPEPEAVELFSDLSTIGSVASIEYSREGTIGRTHVRLLPAYPSTSYAIFTGATALVCWLLAVFVLVNRQGDKIAEAMHWTLASAAAVIVLTYGRIEQFDVTSEILRTLFFVSYMCAPAGLILVASEFPLRSLGRFRSKTAILYCVAFVVAACLAFTHISVTRRFDTEIFSLFLFLYRFIHVTLGMATLLSVVLFFRSYRKTADAGKRRSILRLLLAVVLGLAPLIVLNLLPQFWQSGGRVPEQYSIMFVLVIPFTLMVIFLHSTMMNVQVETHRGSLRVALSFIVWCVYLLAVFATAAIVRGEQTFSDHFVDIAVILGIALVFVPARRRFMRTLDEALFPVRTSLQRLVLDAESRIHREIERGAVAIFVANELHSLLRLDACAVYTVVDGDDYTLEAGSGPDVLPSIGLPAHVRARLAANSRYVLPDAARDNGTIPTDVLEWLHDHAWSAMSPMYGSDGAMVGFVCLRAKTKIAPFQAEEMELFSALCDTAARALDRLFMHERMIIEAEERRRLEEINRMKSSFVSGVSHQLRTPLTSIRMFAEMLHDGRIQDVEKAREYLEIIDGEAARLARLIDNVLNFSRIERGVKEYRREAVDPISVVRSAAAALRYQFLSEHAVIALHEADELPIIRGDADALQEALMNLLDNALKYSLPPKTVTLTVSADEDRVSFSVRDRGVGIEQEKIRMIFDPFFRARDPNVARAGGAGLGLALVSDIVHAHGGSVDVESVPGEGSIFTLHFPVAAVRAAESAQETNQQSCT